jgi:hypothetical protein
VSGPGILILEGDSRLNYAEIEKMGFRSPITLISEITKMGIRKLSPPINEYDMLQMLLNNMFSTDLSGTCYGPVKDESVHIPEAQEKSERAPIVEVKQDSITADIERLEDALGYPLESGQEINITLQELLRIAPRKRPRKDSYKHFQRVLKDEEGVILTIKSQKG